MPRDNPAISVYMGAGSGTTLMSAELVLKTTSCPSDALTSPNESLQIHCAEGIGLVIFQGAAVPGAAAPTVDQSAELSAVCSEPVEGRALPIADHPGSELGEMTV